MDLSLQSGGAVGHQGRVPSCDEVLTEVSNGMANDELRARVRERIVPYSVAGQVVAGCGEAGDEA